MNVSEKTAENVVNLNGNLYLVPRASISYVQGSVKISEKDKIGFHNPRHFVQKNKAFSPGLEKQKMEQLAAAIAATGLNHPITIGCFGSIKDAKTFFIIAGERRKRAIDMLVAKKTPCYDQHTISVKNAEDVYKQIECRIIENASLESSFKIAFDENEQNEGIGEAATIALVKFWKDSGWDTNKIKDITGKSITWVRDTEKLIDNLDETSMSCLISGQINRAVAIDLSSVVDPEERHRQLKLCISIASQRLQEMRSKIDDSYVKYLDDADVADINMQHAKNRSDKAAFNEKKEKAQAKAQQALLAKQMLEEREGKASIKDLNTVRQELHDIPKPLTAAKMKKFWYDMIHDTMKEVAASSNENKDEMVKLMKFMLHLDEESAAGNRNLADVVSSFAKRNK